MTNYPGHDTEFFIVINGVTTGPLVGLEAVEERHITANTPVWYDGLDDWQPAIMAPLTRQLFTPDSAYHRRGTTAAADEPAPVEETAARNDVAATYTTSTDSYSASADSFGAANAAATAPERPKPYMVWAIVVAVIFNIVCGLIAVVYAVKVKSKYAQGNYAGSLRCSTSAQWWIAVGICVGLIMTAFNLLTGQLL